MSRCSGLRTPPLSTYASSASASPTLSRLPVGTEGRVTHMTISAPSTVPQHEKTYEPSQSSNRGRRLAIQSAALGEGAVFAIGARTGKHQVTTGENALVRIDPASNRVEAVTSLPRDAGSAVTYGAGALWVAQLDGPSIYRIDPETGR